MQTHNNQTQALNVESDAATKKSHHDDSHGAMYTIGIAYGHFIYRIRWLVLAVWVIALAISAPYAVNISSVLSSGGYTFPNSESVKADSITNATFNTPLSTALVVLQSDSTPVSDPAYQQEIQTITTNLQSISQISSITKGTAGQDGNTTFLVLNFTQDASAMENHMKAIQAQLPSGSNATPAHIYLTGDVPTNHVFSEMAQKDVEQADVRAIPIALVVLLIVFGSLLAAFLPLMLAIFAVPVALAIVYAIATHFSTNSSVLSLSSIIGLGLSIDYTLFMVRRFREELSKGREVRDAIGWTVATAGEAILFSGLTVTIGFAGLLLIGIQFMSSLGIAGASIVLVAAFGALTLVPAVLSILGRKVNALRIPILGKLVGAHENEDDGKNGGFWRALALGVMKRPILIIIITIAILMVIASPTLQIQLGTGTMSELPTSNIVRKGYDIFTTQFPNLSQNPVQIVIQSADGESILTPANITRIDAYSAWLAKQNHVTSVSSLTYLPKIKGVPPMSLSQLVQEYYSGAYLKNPVLAAFVPTNTIDNTSIITVNTNTTLDSRPGKALITYLRDNKSQAYGMNVYVGGTQATTLDFNSYLYGNFPKAIAFILMATFFLLMLMFRSILLPLKAVIVNMLSISASYGVIVFVFQMGHLTNLFSFTSEGFIESFVPILMFCTLFGLSMDYEVFLLSRIREEWLRVGNNRYAVARGLEKTGGVITSAAILLIIVAGAIAFTTLNTTKEIGLGVSIAVFIDATLIRTLLVPATMRLIGRWNWWLPGLPIPVERHTAEHTSA